VYVTPDGRLLKRNPSLVVRKDAAAGGGPQSVEASTLARPGPSLRNSARLAAAPRAAAPALAAHPAAPRAPGRQHMSDEAAQTIERLSAFEEHVFSQDPNKTAFLTEESSPLSDLSSSETDEFPLAGEFLPTAVHDGRSRAGTDSALEEDDSDWPEEEDWPEESDLLAEDEFDENLDSRSRKRSRARRPPTARVMLTGIALLLPFALAVGLFVTHFSDPESRAFDPNPALSTLEKLGNAAQRGIITLFSDGEGPRGRWVPGR
jgi:hypothetical protein